MWAIAVHGGAGTISRTEPPEEHLKGLKSAILTGTKILTTSAPLQSQHTHLSDKPKAVVAAVAAVQALEDNPLFNAGYGSVLTTARTVEMEAALIDGKNGRSGAVTGLTTVGNPILLASLVLVKSQFQFLGFSSAEKFGDGFPGVVKRFANERFVTEGRVKSLERALKRRNGGAQDVVLEPETVGAVVLDEEGNVACATSTGGISGKVEGRIGDTPMVGAGSFAENGVCAVSGTGIGEEFIRHGAAGRVGAAMSYGGMGLEEAVRHVVFERLPKGAGGFIGVDCKGTIVREFNSGGMYRACMDSNGLRKVGIWGDELDF